jgi:hypothetical protein
MPEEKTVHLFRGALCVHSWSKYQATVEDWTLCGINRRVVNGPGRERADCVEEPSQVSCRHCLDLMGSTVKSAPRKAEFAKA